ncbi:MAG TPA: Hsp20/alpha crystallin family protein [Gemmatimonadaceae bacterium]|jgi:HSP20 family protein|nr:Hsp20/alpha crystallin family protein [Gemmatimonadaceae bacterium]
MPTILTRTPAAGIPFLSTVTRDLEDMQNRLRRAFGAPLMETMPQTLGWNPAMEVAETPTEFTVTAEVPGMTTKDVNAEYDDGVLTLRGEKAETRTEKDQSYHVWERSYGTFERSFTFPAAVDQDKITATCENGVLTVHLPKSKEAKSHGRKIAIAAKA